MAGKGALKGRDISVCVARTTSAASHRQCGFAPPAVPFVPAVP
jgi:hypothetical protein